MEAIFWICIGWVVYAFAGYPVVAWALAVLRRRTVRKGSTDYSVTVLISAYNEASFIEATVRNKLQQDYPADRLEVLVVSDGSDDGTDDIVRRIDDPRVRLIRQENRAGKTAALNRGASEATGEIIVFSDANSMYEPKAIRRLVANFHDPRVGYVTGKMIYQNLDGSVVGDGCTGYMRYENRLREIETSVGSVVGVDGGIDAVRASLYRPMRPDQIPDFVLPLSVVANGYRVVYEPDAVLREDALSAGGAEFRMRVRVALRSLWAMWDMLELFNPFRHGIFSLQILSHKLLRYAAFLPLSAMLLLNVALLGAGNLYHGILILQLAFYFCAAAGAMDVSRARLFAWPWYFVLVNLASGVAFVRFFKGEKQVLWVPREGT